MARLEDSPELLQTYMSKVVVPEDRWETASEFSDIIVPSRIYEDHEADQKLEREAKLKKIEEQTKATADAGTEVKPGEKVDDTKKQVEEEEVLRPIGPPESLETTRRMTLYRWSMANILSEVPGYPTQEICPYWPDHFVEEDNLGEHIRTCRAEYKTECEEEGEPVIEIQCAFNREHLVPFQEINFHHTQCETRRSGMIDAWVDLKLGKENQEVREEEEYQELFERKKYEMRMVQQLLKPQKDNIPDFTVTDLDGI